MSDPAPSARHVPALDGFRGIAIILVMMSHFIHTGGMLEGMEGPWVRLLQSGYVGVDMFFLLSGFLITGILLDAPKTGGRYFKVFYLRRAVRIFPLYYAVLIGVYATCPPGPDSPLWYWLFAANIGGSVKTDWVKSPVGVELGHFWSLAVEEQFYFIWPLLVRYLNRRHLELACLACLFIATITNYKLYQAGYDNAAYLFTACRLNTLGAGAWLAIVYRDPERWRRWMRMAPFWFVVGGAYCVAAVMYPASELMMHYAPILWGTALLVALRRVAPTRIALPNRVLVGIGKFCFGLYLLHFLFEPWMKNAHGGWIAGLTDGVNLLSAGVYIMMHYAPILWGASLMLAMRPGSPLNVALSNRVLVVFGKYSYGLYMLHFLFEPWMRSVLYGRWITGLTGGVNLMSAGLYIVVAFALSFAMAWVSWQVLERPMLSLKRYFRY